MSYRSKPEGERKMKDMSVASFALMTASSKYVTESYSSRSVKEIASAKPTSSKSASRKDSRQQPQIKK